MIHHPNIGSRIYDVLCRQIISGKLKPGEHLREEHLTKELRVSRTPLRDAITRMVKNGYLEVEPRLGARVRKFSAKDVTEIYDIRKALESMAVRLATGKIDHGKLKRIKKQFFAQDVREREKADRELHYLIITHSGNGRLIEMLGNLYKLIGILRKQGYRSPLRAKNVSAQHVRIIDALQKKAAELAIKRVYEHIENTKQEIIAELETLR